MAVWDELKAAEKPERTSVLDGIPQGMPSLGLADKLLGSAHRVGLTDSTGESTADPATGLATGVATGPAAAATEPDALGDQLLAIVPSRGSAGLDAERGVCVARCADCRTEIRDARGPEAARPEAPSRL